MSEREREQERARESKREREQGIPERLFKVAHDHEAPFVSNEKEWD